MDRRVDPRPKISRDRASRLYRLVVELSDGPQSRNALVRRLKVGVRTFFRDMDLLRECGIGVEVEEQGYTMGLTANDALALLPFPDPELSFGDVIQLMRGRSQVHRRLKKLFERTTA